MRKIFVLICVCVYSPLLFSQSQTTVTGLVETPTGVAATSGYVEFRLTPQSSGIAFRVSGVGVLAPAVSRCTINGSGTLTSCLVWGNPSIAPANTCYDVVLAPNGVVRSTIRGELISGTTYDLSSPVFCPNVAVVPAQQAAITTTPIQSNIIPGANKVFTLGSASNYFSSGYVDTLFSNSFISSGNIILGSTTTDVTGSPKFIAVGTDGGFVATSASVSGLALSMGLVSSTATIAVGKSSSSGSFGPLLFSTNSQTRMTIVSPSTSASGGRTQVLVGGSSTDYLGSPLLMAISNGAELAVATGTSDASKLNMLVSAGQYAQISSDRTTSFGTYLPLTFWTGGVERMRLPATGTNAQLVINGTSTDVANANSGVVTVGNQSGFVAASASTNASTVQLQIINGVTASITAGQTNSGTFLPLAFSTNGAEAFRVTTTGPAGSSVVVGATTTDLSVSTPSVITVGNTSGFIAAGFSSNASVLSMTVVNGSYASIASNRTGSGTYLPISLFTSATEQMRITTGGGVFMYNLTNANAQDYVCYNTGTKELEQNVTTCNLSTETAKHDIHRLDVGLDVVLAMQPVSFVRNAHPELGPRIGFTAQRTEPIDSRLVTYFKDGTLRSVDYEGYTAVLTRAIQELEARVRMLEAK